MFRLVWVDVDTNGWLYILVWLRWLGSMSDEGGGLSVFVLYIQWHETNIVAQIYQYIEIYQHACIGSITVQMCLSLPSLSYKDITGHSLPILPLSELHRRVELHCLHLYLENQQLCEKLFFRSNSTSGTHMGQNTILCQFNKKVWKWGKNQSERCRS